MGNSESAGVTHTRVVASVTITGICHAAAVSSDQAAFRNESEDVRRAGAALRSQTEVNREVENIPPEARDRAQRIFDALDIQEHDEQFAAGRELAIVASGKDPCGGDAEFHHDIIP